MLLFVSASFTRVSLAQGDEGTEVRSVPLIFDTDIGNDVDDVLALGMIHALQSRGECRLLAVTITKDHKDAAAFTDAVNTFYGRGEIPIGVCSRNVTNHQGRFNGLANQRENDVLRYPHDLLGGDDAADAVVLLRQTLAAAKDHSVVIVQVGFSSNLAALLDSSPDAMSDLSGMNLVNQKVRLLSVMAGAFTKIRRDGELVDHREYNIIKDIPAAKKLAASWPTEIQWSGFEIGIAVPYPHESIEQDFGYVKHHPLADSYIAYNPPPHNRPTWDLTSVLQAVRPSRDYFGLSKPGHVTVADDGQTIFVEKEGGKHRYLTLTPDQKIRVIETLVTLSSEPPH